MFGRDRFYFQDGHVVFHDRHNRTCELTPEGAFDLFIWLSEHYLAITRLLAQGVPPLIDEAVRYHYDGSIESTTDRVSDTRSTQGEV